jgi:hypothetical protein
METLTDQKAHEIKKEIETIVINFLNPDTLSFETHTALRANVDGFVQGSDGKIMFTDYKSYNDALKLIFESFQRFIEMKVTKIYTYALAPDAAVCTTEFKGRILLENGDTRPHNGCWTFVFKKFNGEWKVIHENGTHTQE